MSENLTCSCILECLPILSLAVSNVMAPFRFLIQLNGFSCRLRDMGVVLFSAVGTQFFPAPFVKEVIFSVVYVFDGFVKDKVVVTVCVYFCTI